MRKSSEELSKCFGRRKRNLGENLSNLEKLGRAFNMQVTIFEAKNYCSRGLPWGPIQSLKIDYYQASLILQKNWAVQSDKAGYPRVSEKFHSFQSVAARE